MNNKKAKSIRRVVRREVRRADIQSKRPRWMPKGLWERFIKRVSLAFKPQTKGEGEMSGRRAKLNRQIERRNIMNNKGQVRIPIPQIGGGQQVQFDIREAVQRKCAKCDGEHFDAVVKLAVVSKMSPTNRTGQDVLIKIEVYLCRACGLEFGQPVPVSQ